MEDIEELFKVSRPQLLAFASGLLKNAEDAQEVVQEVFCQCFLKKPETLNRSYLFKAVRNRSFNKLRSKKRFTITMEKFSEFIQSTLSPSEPLSLSTLIENLPLKQKEVLILRIKGELKIKEIADILNIPEGTVKSRINKSLKSLRNQTKDFSHEK